MADEGVFSVKVLFEQMRGFWDMAAYQRYVAAMTSDELDTGHRRAFGAARVGGNRTLVSSVDETGRPSALVSMLQDCAYRISAFETEMLSAGVDTLEAWQWASLHLAIVHANCLVLVPDFVADSASGAGARELVSDVATWVDVMCRAADADLADTAVPTTPEFMLSRVRPIYEDIICGRGCAWLSYVDGLGRQAATCTGESYDELLDVMTSLELSGRADMLACLRNLSRDDAGTLALTQALVMAATFDELQWSLYSETKKLGSRYGRPRTSLRHASVRPEVIEAFSGYAFPSLGKDGLRGWCDVFRVHPVSCVCTLPRAMHEEAFSRFAEVVSDE